MEDESPTPASPELDGLSYPPSTNKAAPAPSSAYPAPSYHASPSLASRPKNATLDTRISEDSAFDDAFIHVEDDDDALLVRGSPTRGFRGYSAAEDPEGSEWIPPRPRRDLRNTILLAAVALVVIVVVVYYSLPSSQAGGGNGSGGGGGPIPPGASPVLLISLDGFRPRYLSPENTPNLLALAKTGAIADSMSPVFPSVTFANHYSIATGLWPESHGIVGNIFKAPDVKDGDKDGWFDHGPGGDSRYWFGEPVSISRPQHSTMSWFLTCWSLSRPFLRSGRPSNSMACHLLPSCSPDLRPRTDPTRRSQPTLCPLMPRGLAKTKSPRP